MRFLFFATLAVATVVSSSNLPSFVLKESVGEPLDWVKLGPAPDSHMLNLKIGLKQRSKNELENLLLNVSTPSSPDYGKYLSKEKVDNLLQPTEEADQSVKRWLSNNDIKENVWKRSSSGDWISTSLTVAKARSLLGHTQFHVYQHRSTGEKVVRTTQYHVPRDVFDHIDLISPTTYFEQSSRNTEGRVESEERKEVSSVHQPIPFDFHKRNENDDVPKSCNSSLVTIQCIRDFYGTSDYEVQKPESQLIGTTGFLEQYASNSDLHLFLQEQRPEAAKANYQFQIVNINGSRNDQSKPEFEGALDTQMVAGMAFPIPSTYYSVGGKAPLIPEPSSSFNSTNQPFATFFDYLLGLDDKDLPSVVSVSYDNDEQTVPMAYQQRTCFAAAALGLRGVSIFVAAGDRGVGSAPCLTNDGKKQTKFQPIFPASCPYVTTVGATEDFSPERSTYSPQFYSGGGFSNSWPMPEYQKDAVQAYVASLNGTYQDLYNSNGRAYPDMAAQGANLHIALAGKFKLQSGTSASSPLVAGIVGLLSDKRISEGKPRLGFLNPALYSGVGEKGLRDITIGNSKGCGTNGFPAKEGWDAVSGWGTPDFKKLSDLLS